MKPQPMRTAKIDTHGLAQPAQGRSVGVVPRSSSRRSELPNTTARSASRRHDQQILKQHNRHDLLLPRRCNITAFTQQLHGDDRGREHAAHATLERHRQREPESHHHAQFGRVQRGLGIAQHAQAKWSDGQPGRQVSRHRAPLAQQPLTKRVWPA